MLREKYEKWTKEFMESWKQLDWKRTLKTLDEGELKIGAADTISSHFLLSRLEMFHKMYPNINIQIINPCTLEF